MNVLYLEKTVVALKQRKILVQVTRRRNQNLQDANFNDQYSLDVGLTKKKKFGELTTGKHRSSR